MDLRRYIPDFRPIKAIAKNKRTPSFVLDFMFEAARKNPFNNGIVPTTWEDILANPNTDLSKYSNITRLYLQRAKMSNVNITTDVLDDIAANVLYDFNEMPQRAILRNIVNHPKVSKETVEKISQFHDFS